MPNDKKNQPTISIIKPNPNSRIRVIPICLKARTILLDWFDLMGNHIGYGSYITCHQMMNSIISELIQLAEKGNRPGLPRIIPDGFNEYAISVVVRPLNIALGIENNETHKVLIDPELPTRLVNLFEYSPMSSMNTEIRELTNQLAENHVKRFACGN